MSERLANREAEWSVPVRMLQVPVGHFRACLIIILAAALCLAGTLAPVGAMHAPHIYAATRGPSIAGCPIFPPTNVWNADISRLPVATDSATLIASIGAGIHVHPDFGQDQSYGIPYNVVSGHTVRKQRIAFDYADESDAGPYPIPPHPWIEAGSDQHLLIVDRDTCTLYETWDTTLTPAGWTAGSGAIWNLRSNALRRDGWTSADAAGLPILPGLVRYGEVAAGTIAHALRFTAQRTRKAHIYPARHDAGSGTSTDLPPMGLRVRLKRGVTLSCTCPQSRAIVRGLQRYGMILADNGSNWYISGATDPHWNDDDLNHLKSLTGATFEVVDTSRLRNGP